MPFRTIRVAFAAKNFASGQTVIFTVYDRNGVIIFEGPGYEWGNSGVYYLEGTLWFLLNNVYLVIAEEAGGKWKASKIITENDHI